MRTPCGRRSASARRRSRPGPRAPCRALGLQRVDAQVERRPRRPAPRPSPTQSPPKAPRSSGAQPFGAVGRDSVRRLASSAAREPRAARRRQRRRREARRRRARPFSARGVSPHSSSSAPNASARGVVAVEQPAGRAPAAQARRRRCCRSRRGRRSRRSGATGPSRAAHPPPAGGAFDVVEDLDGGRQPAAEPHGQVSPNRCSAKNTQMAPSTAAPKANTRPRGRSWLPPRWMAA